MVFGLGLSLLIVNTNNLTLTQTGFLTLTPKLNQSCTKTYDLLNSDFFRGVS